MNNKLPEYMLSTPRLIAVILTLALIYLTIDWKIDAKDFNTIIALVFWYFFGSRGKEEARWKTDVENQYSAEESIEQASVDPDMQFLQSKTDVADDSSSS